MKNASLKRIIILSKELVTRVVYGLWVDIYGLFVLGRGHHMHPVIDWVNRFHLFILMCT